MAAIKANISFLKSWPISLLLALLSCTGQKSNHPLLKRLYEIQGFNITPATKAVIILADNSCLPCNKLMAERMTQYLNDPNVVFVISMRASNINISQYLSAAPKRHIIIDEDHVLTDNAAITGSTVLFLKHKNVDTVVQVDAFGLQEQVRYLQSRL